MTELFRYDEADGISAASAKAASRPLDAVNGAGHADAPEGRDASVGSPEGQREAIAAPARGRRRGGSRRGIKNKFTEASRAEILRLGDPIGLVCRVAAGHAVWAAIEQGSRIKVKVRPTLQQRLDASALLLRKILPDLKAAEVSGPSGGPIEVSDISAVSDLELAKKIALLFYKTAHDAGAAPPKSLAPPAQRVPAIDVPAQPEAPVQPPPGSEIFGPRRATIQQREMAPRQQRFVVVNQDGADVRFFTDAAAARAWAISTFGPPEQWSFEVSNDR